MASDRRFTLVLAGWVVLLAATAAALVAAVRTEDHAALTLVVALAVAGALAGLVGHVTRTNRMLARFVEALEHGDFATRFDPRGGAGFAALGEALTAAMKRLQAERSRTADELRFWEAMVDDLPIALLTIDRARGIQPANKAARRLFSQHQGHELADYAPYGEELLRCLAEPGPMAQTIVSMQLPGGSQRAVVRAGVLARLSLPVRVVAIEPVQGALDAVEIGTQTDLVRVLTHEILNSLTPVTSLAGTTAVLLGEEEPDIAEARLAVMTLARRAEGLRRFIDSYRQVARLPEVRSRTFAAQPFAAELARLFAVEWLEHRLELAIDPGMTIEADPDLLAQLLINLLRNAAQATQDRAGPQVRLVMQMDPLHGALVAVEDNGPGVPDARRREVFLPFFTTRPTGTGIGLNVARQIAVAHGWRIEVADSPLGGAAIRLFAAPSPSPTVLGTMIG